MFPSSRLQTGLAIGMLCGIALTLASGCGPKGPKTAPVRGTITYLGLPVPSGTVMFQPADGPAAYGQIKDGAASPGEESLEVGLFAEEEIPWEQLAFTVVHETLRQYFTERRTGVFHSHVGDIIREADNRFRVHRYY